MWIYVYSTHYGDHFTIYVNIKSLCSAPEINIVHQLYFSKKWLSTSSVQFSSVQSLSRVRIFATPWIAVCQASLSITNSRSLLKLMPIELVTPSSHLIPCRPLLLLPPIPPSIHAIGQAKIVIFYLCYQHTTQSLRYMTLKSKIR